jgi:pyruvate formate lyase activating enzyme
MQARHWKHDEKVAGRVVCYLCPHECVIAQDKAGRCLGRKNVGGELVAASYGEIVSIAVDPIEKKPLYHFLPGSEILSVATYGCNLRCPFCQNSEISQQVAPSRHVEPDEILALAKRHGTPSLAYTYNEPCIWYEYLMDAGKLMQGAGIRNVLVTNGMLNPEPLAELLPLVAAMNIDLKSIRSEFYRDYVQGDLDTVLNTIRTAAKACHVELTNLLIPGRNDSPAEIAELVDFVASLGRETVLHFSRYFPRHEETEPPTPTEKLVEAAAIARQKLDYVYLGNVGLGDSPHAGTVPDRDTFCPNCRNRLVERSGYAGRVVGIKDGKCANCGRPVDLVLT